MVGAKEDASAKNLRQLGVGVDVPVLDVGIGEGGAVEFGGNGRDGAEVGTA